jgi:hypothetical protein
MRYQIRQTVDIAHPKPLIRYQEALLVMGDDSAHEWIVTVVEDGKPKDMMGSRISASFVRADGSTKIVEGTASENVVTVVFPGVVYLPGALGARIKAIDATGRMTLINAAFLVREGDTDVILNDDDKIPNIEELLALLDDMEASKQACDTATGAATTAAATANGAADRADTATQNATSAAGAAQSVANKWTDVAFRFEMLPPDGVASGSLTQTETKTTIEIKMPQGRVVNATLYTDDATGILYQLVPNVRQPSISYAADPVTTMIYMVIHGY